MNDRHLDEPLPPAKTLDDGRVEASVRWFDSVKGFGFIQGPDEHDVFVHYTAIQGEGFRTLKDHERVTYRPETGEKGRRALDVFRPNNPHADRTPDGKLDGTSRAGNKPTATVGRQQHRKDRLGTTAAGGRRELGFDDRANTDPKAEPTNDNTTA